MSYLSGITNLAGVLAATSYESIFGDIEMKLGGSWISMLIGCFLILVTGVTIAVTLISAKIQSRASSSKDGESHLDSHRSDYNDSSSIGYHNNNNYKGSSVTGGSKPNSRKASRVSTLSNNDYHPYGSLQKFQQETGMCNVADDDDVNNNGCNGEEYTIPDVGEPMTSYEKLVIASNEDVRLEIPDGDENMPPHQQDADSRGDVVIQDGDLSFGKLGDFSSDALPGVMDENEDTVGDLTNEKRSTSFENMLYAAEDDVAMKTEL